MTSLLQALGLGRADVVAVAGAGGKTTLVYRLAREAREAGLRVLVTTDHLGTCRKRSRTVFVGETESMGAMGKVMRIPATRTSLAVRTPDKMGSRSARGELVGARTCMCEADGRGPVAEVRPARSLVALDHHSAVWRPWMSDGADDAPGPPAGAGRSATEASGQNVTRTPGRGAETCLTLSAGARGVRAAVFLNKAEGPEAWSAAGRIAPRLIGPYALVAAGSARGGEVRVWR